MHQFREKTKYFELIFSVRWANNGQVFSNLQFGEQWHKIAILGHLNNSDVS